jgi:hypothetical protein
MGSGWKVKALTVILTTIMLFSGIGGISGIAGNPDKTPIKEEPLYSDLTDATFNEECEPIPLSPGPEPIPMTTILSENFSAPWIPCGTGYDAPPGWTVDGICVSSNSGQPAHTHYWSQFEDSQTGFETSNSTPYAAGVWWSDGNGETVGQQQSEWLISPELNLTMCVNCKLFFNAIYLTDWMGYVGPNEHNYIKASTDGGITWDILGDMCHDPEFLPPNTGDPVPIWVWYELYWYLGPLPLDLSAYDGESSLLIAWHVDHSGGPCGFHCIDDVHVDGSYVNPPPIADAGPNQSVLKNDIVTFNGSGSYDQGNDIPPNRGIINWTWTFTDGTSKILYGKTPIYTFYTPGTTVTLTVRDATNLTATDTMNVTVNDYFNIPIADSASSGGWILLSFPNKISGHPFDVIVDARNDGGGLVQWDIIRHYNSSIPAKWETSAKFWPPSLNTFNFVNNKMGFWLHISNVGDGNLTIAGALPATGEVITMTTIAGWNLIGWPGYDTLMIEIITMTGASWTSVWVYDPSDEYHIRQADIFNEYFEPGHGYWVYGLADDVISFTIP